MPQTRLTFVDVETRFPATDPDNPGQEPPPVECELGQAQAHDFWFKNDNAQDLPVGVFSKTCQCTSVELWLAPKDWTGVPEPAKRDEAAKQLESAATKTELKEKEGGVVVPAGAVGLLRLTWKGDRLGPKSLSATLWMGEKGPGPSRYLTSGPSSSARCWRRRSTTSDRSPRTNSPKRSTWSAGPRRVRNSRWTLNWLTTDGKTRRLPTRLSSARR